jgi:hypothetical protein
MSLSQDAVKSAVSAVRAGKHTPSHTAVLRDAKHFLQSNKSHPWHKSDALRGAISKVIGEASIDYVNRDLYRAALKGMREVNKPLKQRKDITFSAPVTGNKTTVNMLGLPKIVQKANIAGLAVPFREFGGAAILPKTKGEKPSFGRKQAAAHEFVHLSDPGMEATKEQGKRMVAKKGTWGVLKDRLRMFQGIARMEPKALQAYTQNPREMHAYSAIAGTLGVRHEKKKGISRHNMMQRLKTDTLHTGGSKELFARGDNPAFDTMRVVKGMSDLAGGKGAKKVERKFAKEVYKGIERAYPNTKAPFKSGMERTMHKPRLPESRNELLTSVLQEVFKGRIWSKVDRYGTETVGQKTKRTMKDTDVPNPGNKKNAVVTVSTTGRPDKKYPAYMRPDEMKATKDEGIDMRDAVIEAIIEAAYTPPPGLKPVKDKHWYTSGHVPSYGQGDLARSINAKLFQNVRSASDTPKYRHMMHQIAVNNEMPQVVRSVGRKYHKAFRGAQKKREGLLWHQAREAGIPADPREIRRQAMLMMPGELVGEYPGSQKDDYQYTIPSSDEVKNSYPAYGFDPANMARDLEQTAQQRLRGQRLKRRMERRGLQYTPSKKARVTRQMNLNKKGRRGTLPEWLEEAKQDRVSKTILKARKISEKIIRKMEGKKKKGNDERS